MTAILSLLQVWIRPGKEMTHAKIFISLLLVLPTVSTYNLTCPHVSHWITRSLLVCNNTESYVCLWDEINDVYAEKCTGPKPDRPGYKYILNLGNFDRRFCSQQYFQPFLYSTQGSSRCIYQKFLCNGEGQVTVHNGSSTQNRRCRCDYNRGYAFVAKNTHPCFCLPSTEDCSCYIKQCGQGNSLSQDYFCSKRSDKQQNYNCPLLSIDVENGNQVNTVVKTEEKDIDSPIWIQWILVAVILIVTAMIVLIIVRLKNDKEEYFVTNKPIDIVKNEGESVTIDYELSESGLCVDWFKKEDNHSLGDSIMSISLTWYTDKVKIDTDTNDNYKTTNRNNIYSLTILYVSKKYAGDYYLSVNGQHSPVSRLQVKGITEEIIEVEGKSVTISYKLPKPRLPVYWLKDGGLLLTAEDTNLQVENNGCLYTLSIKYVSTKFTGAYRLKTRNIQTSTSIIKINPIFKSDLNPVTCIEGRDVILKCEVIDNNMSATWFKNGEEIKDSQAMEVYGKSQSLKITNAKLSDGGTYKIQIHSAMKEANITVIPYIRQALQDIVIMECLETKFVCKAEEKGITPKWCKDGRELLESDNVLIEESEPGVYSLTIIKTTPDDKGRYLIDLDGHTSEANLDVKDLPEAIKRMSENDRNVFLSAAKAGTASRYYIRVMIVGKNAVGKTCLLRRLLQEEIHDVTSTDGINIEIKRCQIDIHTGEWSLYTANEGEAAGTIADQNKADCSFWDFAGQKEYYATHQTFLTEDAIYLVVVRLKDILSGDMTKFAETESFDNIEEYIGFWLDNIHCYVGTNVHGTPAGNNKLDPPVIVVATGTDEIQEDETWMRKQLNAYLDNKIGETKERNHLRSTHFLSNTNPKPKGFNKLKDSVFELSKCTRNWGQHLPIRWIIFEKQILDRKASGEYVISYDEVAMMGKSCLNGQNIIPELESFLRYEHEVGNIVYFDTLKQYVILDPTWLVDAFRCLVAPEENLHNFDDVPMKKLKTTGKLSNDVLEKLFDKAPKLGFSQHKEFLIEVMDKFDIIVKPLSKFIDNDYYMPCMIRETSFENVPGNESSKTSWFLVEFVFLPPSFFNHIIVFYIRKCISYDEQPILGHGLGIFKLKKNGLEKLVVHASKNCIGLQILSWSKTDTPRNPYINIRKELIDIINRTIRRYRMTLSYDIKVKCAEGKHNNKDGRLSVIDMRSDEEYLCDEHVQSHISRDVLKHWFEIDRNTFNNDSNSRSTEVCDLCEERSQYLCVTCNQSMCEDCRTNHQAWEQYSDHDIKQIGIEYKLSYSFPLQGSHITDVKVLHDGLLVIADIKGNQLITCNIKGEQYNRISVPDEPWRITVVDNNTVAVILFPSRKIQTVDIRHRQIINDIYVQLSYSIMYSNNHLFVGCEDNTIKVVSLSGEVIRTIHLGFMPYYICGDDKEHIYISDYDNNKLHCTDNDLNSMFTFTSPDMIRPYGLTIDNEGYILVVCAGSNNVHRISPDGSHSQIIISHIPPSNLSPYICYDSVSQSVIIGRYDTISVYKQK